MADISTNAKVKLTALLAAQARGEHIAEINVSNCDDEHNWVDGMWSVLYASEDVYTRHVVCNVFEALLIKM